MSWQAWTTLAVVVLTIYALARDTVAPSMSMLGATVLFLVLGIITPAQAFAGFANSAPITVAALYVIARAVEKTGGLVPLVDAALGRAAGQGHRGIRQPLSRMMVLAGGASAFLNNTPIVAMLIAPITDWAERNGRSPSHFLMPLSFAVVLGGVVTTIGTSTNLVVSGLLEATGQAPMALFELTPIGLPIALAGMLLIVLLAPRVLPERRTPRTLLEDNIREFAVHMKVVPQGPLDGRSVEGGGLRHLQGVYLVQLERDGQVIAPVEPTATLNGGDRLTFVGRADLILDLQAQRGLESAERAHMAAFDTAHHTFFEAVIGPASPLVGKSLREASFRSRYQAAVVAIHRAGHQLNAKLGEVELHVADTLILLSDAGFRDRWRDRNDFLVVSQMGGTPPSASRKAWIAGAVTVLVAVVAGAGVLPILQASLVGAFLLVGLGVLTPGEARGAVDLDVVVMIAAAFGVGAAIETTGLATHLGGLLTSGFDTLGPVGVLLGVYLATLALTELITNNAAALIMFPIGMAAAARAGLEPRPFAIAVALAASVSFLSPIGYQTNMMVYGPGGYRFADYPRLGAPLTVVVTLLAVLLIPLVFPLR